MAINQERIAQTITSWLTKEDREVLWLSKQTGIPNSTLNRRIKQGKGFTVEDLGLIAPAIGMDELELLAAEYADQMQATA